jgi:hypothetical protein
MLAALALDPVIDGGNDTVELRILQEHVSAAIIRPDEAEPSCLIIAFDASFF